MLLSGCSVNRNKRLNSDVQLVSEQAQGFSPWSSIYHVTFKSRVVRLFVSSGLPGQHFEGGAPHSFHGRPTCVGENAGEDEVSRGQGFDRAQEGGCLGQRCRPADQPEQDEPVGLWNCSSLKREIWFFCFITIWDYGCKKKVTRVHSWAHSFSLD